jgi:hypothetical protein
MDSTNENLVPVFDVEDQAQEALIKSALNDAGLHYIIVDPDGLEFLQTEPFHHHSQVRVLEHEIDQAKSIIEQVVGEDA